MRIARVTVLALLAAGCDLSETIVPPGESVLVIQAVLRPDLPASFSGRQFIVIEETFAGNVQPRVDSVTGDTTFTTGDNISIPQGGVPSLPVRDAIVLLTNLDMANDPCGDTVAFLDRPGKPGVYWSPQGCPTLRPGDRIALHVQTIDGRIVTGETTIPGMDSVTYDVAGTAGAFENTTRIDMNRDTDTLRLRAHTQQGRLLQLEVRRPGRIEDFGTKILVDSTTMAIPGDLINTFVLGDEDDVFRPGRDYTITVAITDVNYFDFVRSSNNKFTGRGFINRLRGGIGVFGSLVASSTRLRATGETEDPREGRYRMQGSLRDSVNGDSFTVDMIWDIYLARPVETTEYSAFADGDWLYGPIETSADGMFRDRGFLAVVIDTSAGWVRKDTIRGTWDSDGSWAVNVIVACQRPAESRGGPASPCNPDRRRIGTLTMTREP